MTAILEVRDVVTAYGKIEALKGVSLSAEKGRITCLLGPNGAGKTTLMMTIAGILKPKRGSVRLDGEDLTGLPSARIVARGLALVPENRLVFPQMSVKENLEAGAFQRGRDPAIAEDIERMYQRFPRLKDRSEQLAGTMSGGEQQMLAVARALMSSPRILLVDEPSVGLAPILVSRVIAKIRELKEQRQLTVLMAEQNFNQATKIADRGYIIVHGKIEFHGESTRALRENELVKKYYLGA